MKSKDSKILFFITVLGPLVSWGIVISIVLEIYSSINTSEKMNFNDMIILKICLILALATLLIGITIFIIICLKWKKEKKAQLITLENKKEASNSKNIKINNKEE